MPHPAEKDVLVAGRDVLGMADVAVPFAVGTGTLVRAYHPEPNVSPVTEGFRSTWVPGVAQGPGLNAATHATPSAQTADAGVLAPEETALNRALPSVLGAVGALLLLGLGLLAAGRAVRPGR
ncbi:hypothetical protein [Streptomyces sp. NPDC058548]|uniref:hypothetical protein n=1 Tax=unclassified Streptomyces TaxID=2593676 RepID=UPI0036587769